MERLKDLAENLILQVEHHAEKKDLLETIFNMVRVLSDEHPRIKTEIINEPLPSMIELPPLIAADPLSLNEVLRGVEEDLSVRLTHSNIQSLREAIGVNDRFIYVEKLFGNNIERFITVIEQMDKAGSYEASEQVLIEELTLHVPDDAPILLIDQLLSLVRRRFPSK
jgi:hypothetical protein